LSRSIILIEFGAKIANKSPFSGSIKTVAADFEYFISDDFDQIFSFDLA